MAVVVQAELQNGASVYTWFNGDPKWGLKSKDASRSPSPEGVHESSVWAVFEARMSRDESQVHCCSQEGIDVDANLAKLGNRTHGPSNQ